MKKFSMNKSKRTIATIVLIVFLGTIVLSGLAALIISIAGSGTQSVSVETDNTQTASKNTSDTSSAVQQSFTPAQSIEVGSGSSDGQAAGGNKPAAPSSAASDSDAPQNSAPAPAISDLKVYSTDINPEIQTEISGSILKLTAKVNVPDGIVFAADAYTSKDLMNTRESIKAKSSGGVVKFDIPITAESGETILGILKMDMSDNAGNKEAEALYGKNGEKLTASGKNASISDYKNNDGTTTGVYYYKFTIVMK